MMSDVPSLLPVSPDGSTAVLTPGRLAIVLRTAGADSVVVSTSMGESTPWGTPPAMRVS